jgi:hypothetical protein
MRTLFVAALLVFFASLGFGVSTSWPGKPYVEVRAYAYNRNGDMDRVILKNDRLDHSVINKHGVPLEADQTRRLVAAVTGKRPEPHFTTACFNPRHAFVFYNAEKKPVAWVELCFECGNAAAEPHRPDQVYDVAALENLAKELKLPLVPR